MQLSGARRAQAVDAHVSKSLFEDCICGALKDKTRVLVTHQLQYLASGAFDRVVVLKDGGICEQGSYAELMARQGEMYRLVQAMEASRPEEEEDAATVEGEADKDTAASSAAASASSLALPAAGARPATKRQKSTEVAKAGADADAAKKPKKSTALMTQEERQTGSVSSDIYWYYFRSWGTVLLPIIVFGASLATQVMRYNTQKSRFFAIFPSWFFL